VGTEFKVGAGLACLGIAVALSQWLIHPDRIAYDVRFVLILIAVGFGLSGMGFIGHALRKKFASSAQRVGFSTPVQNLSSLTDVQRENRLRLLELREEGVNLHNQRVLTPSDYRPWEQRFEEWHCRILEAANAVNPELRARLSPLRDLPQWDKGWAINRDHRLAQNMIWETLDRIEKYLDRTG
jgi:hypothetical protein